MFGSIDLSCDDRLHEQTSSFAVTRNAMSKSTLVQLGLLSSDLSLDNRMKRFVWEKEHQSNRIFVGIIHRSCRLLLFNQLEISRSIANKSLKRILMQRVSFSSDCWSFDWSKTSISIKVEYEKCNFMRIVSNSGDILLLDQRKTLLGEDKQLLNRIFLRIIHSS